MNEEKNELDCDTSESQGNAYPSAEDGTRAGGEMSSAGAGQESVTGINSGPADMGIEDFFDRISLSTFSPDQIVERTAPMEGTVSRMPTDAAFGCK
jgi:hypothetical protein